MIGPPMAIDRDLLRPQSGHARADGSKIRAGPCSPLRASNRFNAICPSTTMFPLDFPWSVLRGASEGDWVLDPFCGRGTTLFAARLRGLGSVGIDIDPVCRGLGCIKTQVDSASKVARLCERASRIVEGLVTFLEGSSGI